MTNAQIQEYITNSLNTQDQARAEYFTARTEYAKALGRGNATSAARKNVEDLQAAYYAI